MDKNGKRRRFRREATVQTKTAANAEADRLMAFAARTGSLEAEPEVTVPTFASFVDAMYRPVFMARLRAGTRERYEGILKQGVLDHFARTPLDRIGAAEVLAYAAELRKRPRKRRLGDKRRGIDPRGHVNFIKSVLRAAVTSKMLERMPELPNFAEPAKLPAAPSAEHVAGLLDGAPGWLRTACALQALGGLRQGEVRALQVGDVDFEGNLIRVCRAFSADEIGPPKGNRDRVVPMIPELAAILRESVRDKLPRAFVVTDEHGRPVRRQDMLARLKAFEKKAGLEAWWCHALRHYFCSALTRGGANIESIRVLAGHANLHTTQRYVHATGADLRDAIGKLGRT